MFLNSKLSFVFILISLGLGYILRIAVILWLLNYYLGDICELHPTENTGLITLKLLRVSSNAHAGFNQIETIVVILWTDIY